MACKLNIARGGFDDIEKILKDGEVLQIQVNNSIIENLKKYQCVKERCVISNPIQLQTKTFGF
jgi:hypothetical protein